MGNSSYSPFNKGYSGKIEEKVDLGYTPSSNKKTQKVPNNIPNIKSAILQPSQNKK